MRRILILLLIFYGHYSSAAPHYNSWFRATLKVPAIGKWAATGEVQYRRQNGINNTNPLSQKLMYSFRGTIFYRYNKQLSLFAVPFSYFNSHRIISAPADYTAAISDEYRIAAGGLLKISTTKNLTYKGRGAVEYRMFEHNPKVTRLRFRNSAAYSISKKWAASVGYEVLVNAAGKPFDEFYDQTRATVTAMFTPDDNISVAIGYMHLNRARYSIPELLPENNFVLNITYHLSQHQAKHS